MGCKECGARSDVMHRLSCPMLRRIPLSSPWVFLEQFAPQQVARIYTDEKLPTLAEECKAIEELAEACEVIEELRDRLARTNETPSVLAKAEEFLERVKRRC